MILKGNYSYESELRKVVFISATLRFTIDQDKIENLEVAKLGDRAKNFADTIDRSH